MYQNEINRCLNCLNAKCQSACPLHNDIANINKALKEKDEVKALDLLYATNPFPYITSRVCDHHRQCQGHCIKKNLDRSIEFSLIEKMLGRKIYNYPSNPKNGQEVKIVGSGIGALAAAKLLLIKGFKVTIYEKESFAGGTMITGIPDYRLKRKHIQRAVEEVKELGAKFILNFEVKQSDVEKWIAYNQKVILAIGASISNKISLDGIDKAKDGLDLLYDLNIKGLRNNYLDYHKIAVIGGGNVALDCARSLKHFKDHVDIIYRRTIKEMPCSDEELKEAINEGVKIYELFAPKAITDNGLVVNKTKLVESEDGQRANFITLDEDIILDYDLVVMAIGQKIDTSNFCNLKLNKKGRIEVDENHLTSIDGVYALGDCVLGPKNVASAIYDAIECVNSIVSAYEI